MDSTNKILFVFEGFKEKSISTQIEKHFLNGRTVITCVFGTVIYSIYKELVSDPDLDVFSLLKNKINELKDSQKDDFSEIYLFFDYDNHASNYNEEKLNKLLQVFDNETENGKLYISYPMLEALKHFHPEQEFSKLTAYSSKRYKNEVNQYCKAEFKDINSYSLQQWKTLLKAHLFKMNLIINNDFSYPKKIYSQEIIFDNQKEKFIKKEDKVAVLSAFPIFIHDYFGNEKTKFLIS